MPGSVSSLGEKLPVPLLSSQRVGWGALSITEDCRVLLRASIPVGHVSGTGLRRESGWPPVPKYVAVPEIVPFSPCSFGLRTYSQLVQFFKGGGQEWVGKGKEPGVGSPT